MLNKFTESMIKKTSFILLFIFLSFSAFSQIVNIEKKRKDAKGFQANIGLEFNLKNNGKQFLELKNTADIQYIRKAHTFIFLNDIQLLNIDKGSFINNGFQHLRYNYTIKDSSFLTLEAFGQYQYNEQKLLQKRIISGGGPRFALFRKENISFYIAPLAMFEHELLFDSVHTETKLIRGDLYTNLYFNINDFVTFSHILYYQPAFSDFTDYRISSEAGLNFNITEHLAYKVNFAFDYDNQPPPDVQNTFWYLNNKLVLKF
jgi:hypothetical protein